MTLITVIAGTTPAQVDEDTYEIVQLMICDLPSPVKAEDLFDVVQLLKADGYPDSAITIALTAKSQVERDNYWLDQRLADAAFIEHGVQL